MYAVERIGSYISRGVYTVSGPFHPFGGAVDIIVVQQQDGSFKSSPWYVKFGKFQGVLKAKEKVVNISVNGIEAGFHMYLDHKGEAYFFSEVDGAEGDFGLSPPSSSDETDGKSENGRITKSQSCNFDGNQSDSVTQIEMGNGKIVSRTSSRRSTIFGRVFGRKSFKGDEKIGEGDDNAQRISSLERAEIAADLLEVKWSTNLSTDNGRRDNASTGLFDPDKPHEVADRNVQQVNDTFAQPILHESGGPYGKELASSFGSGTVSTEDSEYLEDREQVLETVKVETRDLGDADEVLESETNEFRKENLCLEEIKVSISETTTLDMQSEQASDERGPLFTQDVSKEEGGERGVSSYLNFETSESLSVGADYFSEESFESSSVPHRLCSKEVEVHTEVLINTAERPTEAWSQAESAEDSIGKRVSFESSAGDGGEIVTESLSLLDANVQSSYSGEDEVVEVIVQDTVIERFIEKSSVDETLEISDNESQIHRVAKADQVIDSIKEVASQEVNNLMEEISVHELLFPESTTINFQEFGVSSISTEVQNSAMPLPECSEEDLFLFDDSNNFVGSQIHCEQPIPVDAVEAENHSFLTLGVIEDERESNDLEAISTLPSNLSFGSRLFPNSGSSSEELVQESSPISIPKKREGNIELLFGSVPNIRSGIHDIECSGVLQRLSRSMDLETEVSKWGFLREHFLSSSKANEPCKSEIVHHPTTETTSELLGIQSTGDHQLLSIDPAVEISLCRHMLHEGMGANAACRAFDAEKVDLVKFNALGPSIVKNDRLVVRIGGRYFPWDAAAPFILGMASFGREHIFDLKKMIAVEKAERDLEVDPSRAIVDSGGSWRIWPFNFKKSKGTSPALPTPEDLKLTTVESASDVTGDTNKNEARYLKKKVRSNTPTSEQLASLNLKDGQNVITFTFSTAMLGRQQVDAKIYLWKWNTRIVVSDVDGTITKSDVLGQFMPLVGKDWSQSGVAHLFSAIKDNGYQLLFLSARSISQAYLTRQFLFNLKQDGKALPDGPVVISPDGLFPSLYREVIRRAPHEFKISCLEDIRALFPPDCNPFYAGFGNRDTDEFSYIKVGIPKGKIFIINPKGEVVVNRRVDTKSYTSLHSLVHGMFPATFTAEQEDFNSWNFWKVPPPDIDI